MSAARTGLPRYLLLYGTLFGAFGVASPFFAAFLAERGLSPEMIGVALAAGTGIRLLAGPVGGRIADRSGQPRRVLVACATAASLAACLYLPARGVWALTLVAVLHASVLAPLTPIADSLTLGAAACGSGFQYGWVRGIGSAAFILGTLLSGLVVRDFGLTAIIWLNGLLLGAAALSACWLPDAIRPAGRPAARTAKAPQGGFLSLLRLPRFRRLMVVAALIQGSHALHDGFVVIEWRDAGIADATIGLLWSESVAGEVLVFLVLGPWLLRRLGPVGASVLCAGGGVLRWATLAMTASATAAAVVEPLHGLTFALQHLACMRLIAAIVPPGQAATAQAFYGTVAVGLATALLTLGCGPLFAHFGAGGFWVMALLCVLAVPVAWGLPRRE